MNDGIALVIVVGFAVLLSLNVPVAVAIALLSSLAIFAAGGNPLDIVAAKMVNGIDSFALLAIPFFILAGLLMGRGGMARRLIEFASAIVGRYPGGLAYVNTLTCMLFGSISGSSAAAVSSVGGFMIPEMVRKGYGREFSVAVSVTSATTGLLIPPSNAMIVFAVCAGNVSIAALFLAGVFPGILVGLALMAASGIVAVRRRYAAGEKASFREVLRAFRRAAPSLLLVLIVLGGILRGLFTPTEAAAIAVAYAFALAVWVYREVALRELPGLLKEASVTTAVVMLLIGACQGLSWIMTIANIPQTVCRGLMRISGNPAAILLTTNLLLLFLGAFMDMTPAILIFTPIFLPVAESLGVHPVHFGIMIILNLCIGLCTPPVGTSLFLGCGIGKTTIAKVTGPAIPFFLAMVAALTVVTFVPAVSLWLPRMMGLLR
jgi:tripartite ATP-independent transporter DctM subunit